MNVEQDESVKRLMQQVYQELGDEVEPKGQANLKTPEPENSGQEQISLDYDEDPEGLELAPLEDEGEPEVEAKQEEPQEDEMSELEAKARRMGWRPKDEYQDAPDDFVSAEEFVARAPLYKQIHELKSAIKDITHNIQQAEERGRQKALEELMLQKQLAYQQGNYSKAQELEQQQLDMLQNNPQQVQAQQPAVSIEDIRSTAEWAQFEAENAWIGSDKAEHIVLRDKAAAAAGKYLDIVGQNNFKKEHVPEMIKYIKASLNPVQAQQPAVRRPAPVVQSKGRAADSSSRKRAVAYSKLNAAERLVLNEIRKGKDPSTNEAEYIQMLRDNGRDI